MKLIAYFLVISEDNNNKNVDNGSVSEGVNTDSAQHWNDSPEILA